MNLRLGFRETLKVLSLPYYRKVAGEKDPQVAPRSYDKVRCYIF